MCLNLNLGILKYLYRGANQQLANRESWAQMLDRLASFPVPGPKI